MDRLQGGAGGAQPGGMSRASYRPLSPRGPYDPPSTGSLCSESVACRSVIDMIQGPLVHRGPWFIGAPGSLGPLVHRGPWFIGTPGSEGPLSITERQATDSKA